MDQLLHTLFQKSIVSKINKINSNKDKEKPSLNTDNITLQDISEFNSKSDLSPVQNKEIVQNKDYFKKCQKLLISKKIQKQTFAYGNLEKFNENYQQISDQISESQSQSNPTSKDNEHDVYQIAEKQELQQQAENLDNSLEKQKQLINIEQNTDIQQKFKQLNTNNTNNTYQSEKQIKTQQNQEEILLEQQLLQDQEFINEEIKFNRIIDKEEVSINCEEDCEALVEVLHMHQKGFKEKQFVKKMIQKIKFFERFQEQLLKHQETIDKLLTQLNHKFYIKRHVLFEMNDPAKYFYTILKGSVYVLIEKPIHAKKINWETYNPQLQNTKFFKRCFEENQEIKNIEFVTSEKINSHLPEYLQKNPVSKSCASPLKRLAYNIAQKNILGVSPIKKKRNERYKALQFLFCPPRYDVNYDGLDEYQFLKYKFPRLEVVATLNQGDSFGEIALLTNGNRTATIVCKEDTHIMILSKLGFKAMINTYNMIMMKESNEFFRTFPFFKNFSDNILNELIIESKLMEFKFKQYIYKEGDKVDYLYFIKTGEVEMQKSYKQEFEINDKNKNENSEINFYIGQNHFYKQDQQPLVNKKQLENQKVLQPYLNLIHGSCFGHQDIIKKSKKRTEYAMAKTDTQILALPKHSLLNSLDHQQQLHIFKQVFKERKKWQQHTIKDIKIQKSQSKEIFKNIIKEQQLKYYGASPIKKNDIVDVILKKQQSIKLQNEQEIKRKNNQHRYSQFFSSKDIGISPTIQKFNSQKIINYNQDSTNQIDHISNYNNSQNDLTQETEIQEENQNLLQKIQKKIQPNTRSNSLFFTQAQNQNQNSDQNQNLQKNQISTFLNQQNQVQTPQNQQQNNKSNNNQFQKPFLSSKNSNSMQNIKLPNINQDKIQSATQSVQNQSPRQSQFSKKDSLFSILNQKNRKNSITDQKDKDNYNNNTMTINSISNINQQDTHTNLISENFQNIIELTNEQDNSPITKKIHHQRGFQTANNQSTNSINSLQDTNNFYFNKKQYQTNRQQNLYLNKNNQTYNHNNNTSQNLQKIILKQYNTNNNTAIINNSQSKIINQSLNDSNINNNDNFLDKINKPNHKKHNSLDIKNNINNIINSKQKIDLSQIDDPQLKIELLKQNIQNNSKAFNHKKFTAAIKNCINQKKKYLDYLTPISVNQLEEKQNFFQPIHKEGHVSSNMRDYFNEGPKIPKVIKRPDRRSMEHTGSKAHLKYELIKQNFSNFDDNLDFFRQNDESEYEYKKLEPKMGKLVSNKHNSNQNIHDHLNKNTNKNTKNNVSIDESQINTNINSKNQQYKNNNNNFIPSTKIIASQETITQKNSFNHSNQNYSLLNQSVNEPFHNHNFQQYHIQQKQQQTPQKQEDETENLDKKIEDNSDQKNNNISTQSSQLLNDNLKVKQSKRGSVRKQIDATMYSRYSFNDKGIANQNLSKKTNFLNNLNVQQPKTNQSYNVSPSNHTIYNNNNNNQKNILTSKLNETTIYSQKYTMQSPHCDVNINASKRQIMKKNFNSNPKFKSFNNITEDLLIQCTQNRKQQNLQDQMEKIENLKQFFPIQMKKKI